MKKQGFTLIELLAVIVVLAVIALIAIPIITNVIDKARVGALKDSAHGILDAGELYIANNLKDGIESNLTFTCNKNKCTSETKEINYKGDINAGTLILTTDSKTLVCVDNGKNYALKLANEKDVTTGEGTCGSYEEANGSFNIIEATSARIEALEKENEKLQKDLDTSLDKIIKLEEENNNLNVMINFITDNALISFDYTLSNGYQSFSAPYSGTYKIELWGAQGGGSTGAPGGAGSYTSGIINLFKNEIIYIYVGGTTSSGTGGYNGGGNTTSLYGGGGATDVRCFINSDNMCSTISTDNLNWNSLLGLNSRIMVAAGGGGSSSNGYIGASGGTINGINGSGDCPGKGATQISGGVANTAGSGAGSFGQGGSGSWSGEPLGGGGSGYFGGSSGGGSYNNGSGGSGSSFISGHNGCNAITSSTNSTPTNQSIHYSGKKFTETEMASGKNGGNGSARITLVNITDK